MNTYKEFLESKKVRVIEAGFDVKDLNKHLFPFQQYVVRRALKAGRFAIFADCGLGKTLMQLEWAYRVMEHTGKPVLILAPLAVVGQTIQEGAKFGIEVIEYLPEMITMHETPAGIFITNYEQLDNINTDDFQGIVLDESSILKNFTGATKRKLIELFSDTPYKLCCTATPAPNDLNEFGNHSEFLNILDAQDMRAKWFVRDEGMNNYRLKEHAKKDFYGWISSWAVMFSKPSDIGFSDDGYILPEPNYINVEITTKQREGSDLFNTITINATNHNAELRLTMVDRLETVADIVNGSDELFLVTVKQNAEADHLLKLVPDAIEVRGSQAPEYKKSKLLGFANNEFRVLLTKKKIVQFGLNYQNCHNIVDASPDFSYEGLYQLIRRCLRYGQEHVVNIYLVTTDTMQNVISAINEKMNQHIEMMNEMNKNINGDTYGLVDSYEFKEVKTDDYWLMKGDSCQEIKRIPDNSIDLGIWSPPFSALFTYSNYIHDMGNNENHEAFFKQYAFLLKDIYRIMKPGRLICCHTKDLGVYKNSSGFTGMYDFTGEHTRAVLEAGFKLHSKITIWTDPVLEMQRTKTQRLLYKTVTSDSTYTGMGMSEYIYVFRKWEGVEDNWEPVTNLNKKNFPLDTWQDWASGIQSNDFNNYSKEELIQTIKKQKSELFRLLTECNGGLPQHWYDDVWMDIKRTDVLNGKEGTDQGDEKHIAPLQLEVIHRLVNLWSNKGETVFTPFLGIGSEAYMAVKNNRKAIGIELKDSYFDVACKNVANAVAVKKQIELFT